MEVTTKPVCPLDTVAYYEPVDKWKLSYWLLGGLALAGWLTAVTFIFLWHGIAHAPPPLPIPFNSGSWDAKFLNAAVAADSWQCSEVGRNILTAGGNAVDSAVATLICDGLVNPHSMGLGGGFFMVVFNQTTGKCTTIDAREAAPKAPILKKADAYRGWKSIGVPGEVKGYWQAHKSFGSLPWRELFLPTIRLARDGFYMEEGLSIALHHAWMAEFVTGVLEAGQGSPFSMYMNATVGRPLSLGDRLWNPILARTLERLAGDPNPDRTFYTGPMARDLVDDVQRNGGLLDLEDLRAYDLRVSNGWTADIGGGLSVCTLGKLICYLCC